jgi:translation initiation factor 3 subunit J
MFVIGLVKAISEPMGSEDVKKASSGLTTLMNEKLKAERGVGGKKKAGKKPALVVGAAKSVAPKFDTSNYEDAGDDFDDFMVRFSPLGGWTNWVVRMFGDAIWRLRFVLAGVLYI